MTRIKLVDSSAGRAVLLDAGQMDMFQKELAHALLTGEPIEHRLARIAPDVRIEVREDGQLSGEYELYGRAVLVDVREGKMMQLYMGLLLLEWLDR